MCAVLICIRGEWITRHMDTHKNLKKLCERQPSAKRRISRELRDFLFPKNGSQLKFLQFHFAFLVLNFKMKKRNERNERKKVLHGALKKEVSSSMCVREREVQN